MKKLLFAAISLVLVFGLSACKCSAERQAAVEVDNSHTLIATQLLKYVDADPKLSAKDKADWHGLVDSDKRNIEKLKKALE